jgi:putative restriction endonuclease
MPQLPTRVLSSKLRAALPNSSWQTSPEVLAPAEVIVPDLGRVLIYLWTLTPDRSRQGRPPGEHKIQMIGDGQQRGQREDMLFLSDSETVLAGYSPDYGVFVIWEARLHEQFAYSRNVQVREHLLEEARRTGWAVDVPRRVTNGFEVRGAVSPGNFARFIRLAREAEVRGLTAERKEAFLLSSGGDAPGENEFPTYLERLRERELIMRATRDITFAPRVKAAFNYMCAVCNAQLDIVEAAHIIPVSEEGSIDDVWNGIALCPNHHTLFDSRLLLIRPNLQVSCDDAVIQFLRGEGRAGGADELLLRYSSSSIQQPAFWQQGELRDRMQAALSRRLAQSAALA